MELEQERKQGSPEVFEEIREDYQKLNHDEREQVKGIIVGMNLSRTLRGELKPLAANG